MSEHTKGPWTAIFAKEEQPVPYYAGLVALVAQEPYLSVVAESGYADTMEWEANARLIAAAPDLLEALKALSAQAKLARPSSLMVPLIEDADEAIAKAERGA